MANNRMYLVHRPSGKALFLGKRLTDGWYGVPEDLVERLKQLFADTEEYEFHRRDDFGLYMEDASMAPNAIDDPDVLRETL